jgi:hypothetical protein
MITANGASFRVIVVAIAVTAVFMGSSCINAKGEGIPHFGAEFISPTNSTVVSTPIVSTPVSITFKIMAEAPPNRYIWVLVNPHSASGEYWPQGDNHTKSINGVYPWTVNLGGENDSGKKFDVLLVLVDNITDQRFVNWVEQGKATGFYPSLTLPDKPKELDKITLIRKPTLTITSPPNGNASPYYTDISGTISGILPDSAYVWIVIGPQDSYGDWYPQGKDHLSLGNQKDWSMRVRIGREGTADIGKDYDIRAILVDQDTDNLFREWASKGAEMMANGETSERAYRPLTLPDKAITLDQITVKRGE